MTTSTTVLGDRYELKRRLYSEGNQAAYEARDRVRSDEVVVFLVPPAKKLNADTDQAVRADIERAFDVASPNLIPLLDLREVGDHRFLVMPKPRGTNAWTRITQKKKAGARMGVEQVLRAADDLVAAAEAAHARDLTLGFSPKQVWIEDDGSARVQFYWIDRVNLDGGGPERFQTAGAEGGYFQAPELAEGAEGATPAADQFFICAVLYGLLTGQVPGGKLEPIRRSRADVPAPMADAIERGLAQAPARRHPDLRAFRRAVHRRSAGVGYLVPLLLVLLSLWAGRAVFLGGADVSSWAFEDDVAARRDAEYGKLRPSVEPVPAADEAAVRRFAGHYDSFEEHELWLRPDGSFLLDDHASDAPRHVRGLWWPDPSSDDALVLMPVAHGATRPAPIEVSVENGRLLVAEAGTVQWMTKVGWPSESGAYAPLLQVDAPLAGAVVTERKIRVVGRVAVTGVQVRIGNEPAPVVRTTFDKIIDVSERGDVEVVVSARAKDGFEQTITRVVRVDDGVPEIDVTATLEETDGVWNLDVKGTCVDDGAVVALSVNEEPVKIGADGTFGYARRGVDAHAHAFVEIVAVDDAGRAARRLVWPSISAVTAATLAPAFEALRAALAAGKTGEAEDLLRAIRDQGGLIEELRPETLEPVVRQGREPRITFDDYPDPKRGRYFVDDGTMQIRLRGTVEWFGAGDVFEIMGKRIDIDAGGRFDGVIQLPRLGPNPIPVRVLREGEPAAERPIEVWLADGDGEVPKWTGVPVSEAQRKASAQFGLPIGRTNDLGMHFALIPPGTLRRETKDGQRFGVKITRPYYMQVGEVSRRQFNRYISRRLPTTYEAKSGELPLGDDRHPAMDVSRDECIEFARRLSADQGGTYRLPTEAEWELAARAGDTTGNTYWDRDASQLERHANFADQSIRRLLSGWPAERLSSGNDGAPGTWPADFGAANRFGLKNMLGNASEWVADFYDHYDPFDDEDPTGPAVGKHGVNRGGSFRSHPRGHGFAKRFGFAVHERRPYVGFRLVLESEVR